MSFNDYSDYGFQFNRLDFHLQQEVPDTIKFL